MKISAQYGITDIDDVEDRIAARRTLPEAKIKGLSAADPLKRQKYTIDEIVKNQELWVVFDGDELPTFESSQNNLIHIWPHKELAELFFSKTITDPQFVPIPIDDWIDEILFMPNDDMEIDIAIFPIGIDSQVSVMHRDDFVKVIAEEWHQVYGNQAEFEEANKEENFWKVLYKNTMKKKPKGKLP